MRLATPSGFATEVFLLEAPERELLPEGPWTLVGDQALREAFGAANWWPGDSAFEVMVGAVLTQNTNWGNVVKAIDNMSGVIERVREISTGISSAVAQQGAATAEIARNVQEAARGTQDVTTNIGGVSDAAATTGNSAVLMLRAARSLSKNAAQLRTDASTFLSGVRAA